MKDKSLVLYGLHKSACSSATSYGLSYSRFITSVDNFVKIG